MQLANILILWYLYSYEMSDYKWRTVDTSITYRFYKTTKKKFLEFCDILGSESDVNKDNFSEKWCHFDWWVVIIVMEELAASTFGVVQKEYVMYKRRIF